MTVEIRTVDASEMPQFVDVGRLAFHETVAEGEAEFRLEHEDIDFDRMLAAVDDGDIVATFRSFASDLTLPGGATVTADAITAVGVSPTHRRRRLLTQMMSRDLREARGRGEPVAILIASEYPIYGRFGFGPATEIATYAVETPAVRFRRGAEGHLERISPETAREVAPAVYERFRGLRAGAITRTALQWDNDLGIVDPPGGDRWNGHVVVHRSGSDADPDGYLRYHLDERWEGLRPKNTLVIDELVAASQVAYRSLWGYACEADLIVEIKAENRPVDEPLPWLLENARAVRQTDRSDFLWIRILDPAAALSARDYAVPGELVIEIDDGMELAGGRFALDGGPDGAICQPTDQQPDLRLTVAALGAAYLGGVSPSTLGRAGDVDELTAGALRRADLMFTATTTPWCNTWF